MKIPPVRPVSVVLAAVVLLGVAAMQSRSPASPIVVDITASTPPPVGAPAGAAGQHRIAARGAGPAPVWTDVGPAQATTALRVGIKPLDPFVTRDGGRYAGFSIELWDEIARRNGWTTEYVWYDTQPPMLEDIVVAKLDAAIAGISITREREARFDFSYPMFNAGLQVLAPQSGDASWIEGIERLIAGPLLPYLVGLVLAIFLAGNVVWLFDRRDPYLAGVGRGMFRSATVGLVGEVGEPPHPLARVAAVIWFVIGICFVAAFTASLTTDLTIQQITGNIRSVNDLVGERVVTVRDSTAARYLADRRIDFDGVDAVEDAFRRVEDGGADAVVFDAPVLQHYLQASGSDRLTLVGNVFQREDYGIALPVRSEHRKAVNEALLGMRVDGSYDRIVEHYFGRPQ